MATTGLLNLTSSFLHAVSYLLLTSAGNNVSFPSSASSSARSFDMTPSFALLLPESKSDGIKPVLKGSRDKTFDANQFSSHRMRNPNYEISYFQREKVQDSSSALKIFQKILPNIFNNTTTYPIGREVNYYDGQTIATVQIDPNGKPIWCNLIEVNTDEESKNALDKFAQDKRLVEKANFRVVLGIITACQYIDSINISSAAEPVPKFRNQPIHDQPKSVVTDPNNIWSVASGILPGTKWCGIGDIAKNYDDLGQERRLDKCCRAHDYCPVKVKAFRSAYGLVNWSLYTKSHCQCDSLLYDCLKDSTSPTAEVLGNVYFNVVRVQCVEEENQMKCIQRDLVNQKCKIWQPVSGSGQPRRMHFRSFFKEF